jgi:hypothetical protein
MLQEIIVVDRAITSLDIMSVRLLNDGSTGGCNNFIGYGAGGNFCLTTGSANNFFGFQAGYRNTTGSCNNFIGWIAGYENTSGHYNNFIGYTAGRCNGTACYNDYIGFGAGYNNVGGVYNQAIGSRAGYCNTGSCNTSIGTCAGYLKTSGNNNVLVGYKAGCSTFGLYNLTTQSNIIVIGNCLHTCARVKVAWSTGSDIRDKCVYGDVPHGKAFLQGVNPIKYGFKDRETGELKDDKKRYGFSAQEIASLEDEPIIVNDPDGEDLGVTHDYLLPILVNAIKELDAENKELKERLLALEERVNNLS